jgi:hypothetical protein
MLDFCVGETVEKTTGDYRFVGTVVAVVHKLDGQIRYVVEDDRGLLLLMSSGQLQKKREQTMGALSRITYEEELALASENARLRADIEQWKNKFCEVVRAKQNVVSSGLCDCLVAFGRYRVEHGLSDFLPIDINNFLNEWKTTHDE